MKRIRMPSTMLVLMLAVALLPWQAQAFQFDTGNSDLKLRWDNTLKYSAAYRLNDQSDTLTDDVNYDDGDRNFDKGLVSNRMDWLSELEASLAFGGIRVSGAGWYDQVYNESNDNDSAFSNNATSVDNDEFTDETQELHGKNVELLDAFAYGNIDFAEVGLTLRAGRFTQVYGETLFFGSNGIGDAQGPIDIYRLIQVPGTQFKEVLRPVEQVSVDVQLTSNFSFSTYYQFKWHESRIPAAGSYLSSAEIIGEGTETWILGYTPLGDPIAMTHEDDLEPDDQGQGGVRLRYTLDSVGIDLGLYAAIYHAKTPSASYNDLATMRYRWVYGQDIETYGVSATGSLGQLNWATELSYRRNAPLNSDPRFYPTPVLNPSSTPGNEEDNRLYAVGETAHVNLSGIYVLRANPLCDGGAIVAELAYNSRLDITDNEEALAKNTTKEAYAFRMVFEPTYFQVLTGLDLSVPMGVGYNFKGRSSAIGNFNGGSSNAGDLSVGLGFTYRSVWKAGLSYVKYFGDEGTFTVPPNSSTPHLSFDQSLADRDFISFYLSRAF